MSLLWRILAAFTALIVLSVVVISTVSYIFTKSELNDLLDEMSQNDAQEIAAQISEDLYQHPIHRSLSALLADTRYLEDINILLPPIDSNPINKTQDGTEEAEFIDLADSLHIWINSPDNTRLFDNAQQQRTTAPSPKSLGRAAHAPIYNIKTNRVIGTVHVQGNRQFITDESTQFLADILLATSIGGIITTLLASFLAFALAKKITAPISALTNASQRLANTGNTQALTVNSDDELGKLTQSFNDMVNALVQQRTLRKQLISDVSHDLNTPLSVIRLEASGLRDGIQTPQDAAQQIIQEIDKLRNLVSDLSWMAETDSGEFICELTPGNLATLIETEVQRFRRMAEQHNIHLQLQPIRPLPQIALNQQRLSQAFANVLRNALQYTAAYISKPASKNQQGKVSIEVIDNPQNNTITVQLRDNGLGIAAEHIAHVKERLYRVDKVRNQASGNRGLGLAISEAIVNAHHGQLSIHSDGIGKGTTVNIILPYNKA